ncbi:serine threonine-protein kinase hypothetical protein [Limosa lapponica baueri]|uniref:non-specific serine/threonine protein kinase n=1 Tax=Limosa lapponica baueri TaxID=1758121 RepID=A0A2I0T277_LIMLA|nr:serine threonine-protein kinase hypothetical protein [Limosa lapponica baueri]
MNEDHSTPKKEKQERISKHKENLQHTQAEEEAHLLSQQRLYYDKNCRSFKRKTMIKKHEMEQQNIRESTTVKFCGIFNFALYFTHWELCLTPDVPGVTQVTSDISAWAL